MHDFVLKEIVTDDLEKELSSVGFDKSYIKKACDKFVYKNIKIFDLTPAQANILKQTALSVGADCATHRETITAKVEKTDCILGGSLSQIEKIAGKLACQPFGLKKLGEMLLQRHEKKLDGCKIVGILNLTTNSFSDGGEFYEFDKAVEHLNEMINDGADVVDIGAESTKPYSEPVSDDMQLAKLVPVLEYIKKNNIMAAISIDTRSATVAQRCLELGADIINDVSGFDYDEKMPEVIAEFNAKVVIQHSKGTPQNMQDKPVYSNLMDEIYLGLKNKIDIALSKGIKRENIIIDPGIGFGKTREDNFEIIKRIEEFYGLGCPVMLGVSRKSLLNMPDADNFTKDIFTLALNSLAISKKVDFLRVHNVKINKKLVELLGGKP